MLLEPFERKTVLLYLHIPYCDSKCFYCNFNSTTKMHTTREIYMQKICEQFAFEVKRYALAPKSISSFFIGGGTPSCIEAKFYSDFFTRIAPYLSEDIEITTEANPNSASLEWLQTMKDLGVNRISFGVQSFDDDKLKYLGRAHDSSEAMRALKDAKRCGFEHISLDLIYGVKNDTKTLLQQDIETAFMFGCDHISAYELTIEAGTKFDDEDKKEDESLGFFVASEIQKRGFTHYEISNFGAYKCQHNLGYWHLKEYIGIGAGAVGMHKKSRIYSTNDIAEYINDPLLVSTEHLSDEDVRTEKIFLGLRSEVGIDEKVLDTKMLQKAQILIDEDKLIYKNERFYNKNYFISDAIALYLMD